MLTDNYIQFFNYLVEYFNANQENPSVQEMQLQLGNCSRDDVLRALQKLEAHKLLKRLPESVFAFELLATRVGADSVLSLVRVENTQHKPTPTDHDLVNIPFMGQVAAGKPTPAYYLSDHEISVPRGLLEVNGKHFVMQVSGDSMKEAGICDGDYVIVKEGGQVDSGDIVVALIDHEELTLKRLRRFRGSIALEPANPAYETRIYGHSRVKIQGKVLGLYRPF